MKHERGMGTLMTVFSGIAALMCLLVGLQLLFLESRIGLAADQAPEGSDGHYRQWQGEVHTGAIMSLGAGVLVFLFGMRHQATRNRSTKNLTLDPETAGPSDELESLSIRIFEIDSEDRTVEIISEPDDPPDHVRHSPATNWAPLAEDEPDLDPASGQSGDPADSILNSIREATGSEVASPSTGHAPKSPRSFWANIFGPRKRS